MGAEAGMCGIAGIVGEGASEHREAVRRMMAAMEHRGPDGEGMYLSPSGRCVLGHRRLAILDLSEAAAQPMCSEDGRWAFTYNGECYNFPELRDALEAKGEVFRSSGDTEVVMRLLEREGEEALARLNGMFALALWDEREGRLLLGRDRYGQKPLYTVRLGRMLLFASELRALLASGLVSRRVNPAAVYGYLAYGSIQEPNTILWDARLLAPQGYLRWSVGGEHEEGKYWAPAREKRVLGPMELRESFVAAIERHLLSDAPLGLFLSGGIDSSAVAAAAARVAPEQVKTLSMVYPDQPEQSEAVYARAMADKAGTEHHEVPITGPQMLEELPTALAAMDQPTGDAINTYLVSMAARKVGLKVALSGLGGDELFGGYRSFRQVKKLLRLRRLVGPLGGSLASLLGDRMGFSLRGGKLQELALGPAEAVSAYLVSRRLFSSQQIESLAPSLAPYALHHGLPAGLFRELCLFARGRALQDAVGLLELRAYMAQTLLRDADIMGMSHSLEIRVPFLDTEFSSDVLALEARARTPVPYGKWRFVEAMGDWLPPEVTRRNKQGFTLPFATWMSRALVEEIPKGLRALATHCQAIREDVLFQIWTDFLRKPQKVGWFRPWTLYVLGAFLERHELSMESG